MSLFDLLLFAGWLLPILFIGFFAVTASVAGKRRSTVGHEMQQPGAQIGRTERARQAFAAHRHAIVTHRASRESAVSVN